MSKLIQVKKSRAISEGGGRILTNHTGEPTRAEKSSTTGKRIQKPTGDNLTIQLHRL